MDSSELIGPGNGLDAVDVDALVESDVNDCSPRVLLATSPDLASSRGLQSPVADEVDYFVAHVMGTQRLLRAPQALFLE